MSGNRARDISPSDSKATRRTAFIVISLSSRKNVASGVVIIESKQAADLSQEIVWKVRIAASISAIRWLSAYSTALVFSVNTRTFRFALVNFKPV